MALHGYIADGFADDCDDLMHRCLQEGTLTFEAFTHIWQDMQLSSMYEGRTSGAEIAELSEEVLHTAKHYLVAKTENFEASVAGLFLVYSLLNLQPFTDFAHLRIVQEDLPALERIESIARRDRRLDVLYVLGSVLIKGPVQYHAVARERGMEGSLQKYLEGYTAMDRLGVRPKGVFSRQNEEMDLLRELNSISNRYSVAKSTLSGALTDRNLCYANDDLAKDLEFSLKNILTGVSNNTSRSGPEDSESEDSDDGYRAKNIKNKAMTNKVKGMGHLAGIHDKTNSKTKPELIKDKSPPIKKKQSKVPKCSGRQFKMSEDNSSNCDQDISIYNNKNNEKQTHIKEHEVQIEIDNLPRVIQSKDGEKLYEIEIIDHQKSLGRIDDDFNANKDSELKRNDSTISPIKIDKKRVKSSRAKRSLKEIDISDIKFTVKRVDSRSKKAKIDDNEGIEEIYISDTEKGGEETALFDTNICQNPTTSNASNVPSKNTSPKNCKKIASVEKKDKNQVVDCDLTKNVNEVEICSNTSNREGTEKNCDSVKDKPEKIKGNKRKVEGTEKSCDASVKDNPKKIKGNKRKTKDTSLSGESSNISDSKNKSNVKHDFVKIRLKRLGILPVEKLKRNKN